MVRFRIVRYMHFPIPLIIWNEKLILIYTYTKKKNDAERQKDFK